MGNDIIKVDPAILALIKGAFGKGGVPMPFTKEIFLIETHIAGTSHIDIEETEPDLSENDIMVFKRDPDNKYDNLAIRIYTKDGQNIGFVPRDNNEILAHLMDAGKLIFGKLISKEWQGSWLYLQIKVFLREI
jgi:hypothetical protein